MEKNNLEEYYAIKFRVKLGDGATDSYGKIQEAFGNFLYHVRMYFGGTKTSYFGEKWWKMNRDLNAPPL
jgi:hypothetical protein